MIYSHSNILNENLLRNSQIDQERSMKNWGTTKAKGYERDQQYTYSKNPEP